MVTTVQVSDYVKHLLDGIKKRNGHSSFDSVIRHLLEKAGETD